ncbi:MAG: cyclic nucleotide-binding domain-containing protein [Fibrobacterales bacterium]
MTLAARLKDVNILQDLDEQELIYISDICKVKHFDSGQIIFEEGSNGDELYFILDGSVGLEISKYDGSGFNKFCTLPTNEVVGDLAFIDGVSRSSRAVSLGLQDIAFVGRADLYQCFDNNPRVGYLVMKRLCELISKRLRLTNNMVKSSLDL